MRRWRTCRGAGRQMHYRLRSPSASSIVANTVRCFSLLHPSKGLSLLQRLGRLLMLSDRCPTLIAEPGRLLVESLTLPAADFHLRLSDDGRTPLPQGADKLLGNPAQYNRILRNRLDLD